MPAVDPSVLVNALVDAFDESGAPGILVSHPRQQPRRFILEAETGGIDVWVYAWTLTHGGRPSLPDEYRIQMTSVSSPLPMNPDGYTLLLGYEPNLGIFAGFDLLRHSIFTAGSPSVQIDVHCLHSALQDGLAFDRKSNQETAIGIRPDQMLNYMANASDLHRLGKNAAMYTLLSKASASGRILKRELAKLSPKRRRVLSKVSRCEVIPKNWTVC